MSESGEHAAIAETDTPTSGNMDQVAPQKVPFQMIPPGSHFFANPFMTPYIGGGTQPPSDDTPPPSQSSTMPPMMFSPAQYQEMMQHYFQQMMAASGAQFPIPFPVQFQPNIQQPQQFNQPPRPSSQCSSSSTHPPQKSETTPATAVKEVADDNVEEVVAEKIEEESATIQSDNPPVSSSEEHRDANEDTELAEKRKLSGDRTDSLIRKQMNEIEKEISRRSQNKNIKKIDDDGLAEFIGSSATATSASTSESFASFNDQSALSYTPPVSEKPAPATKETLNQLRNSFNLTDHTNNVTPTPTIGTNSMFANSSTNSSPFSMTIPQQMHQPNVFVQPTQFNGTNPFVPQLNASFVQQQQNEGQNPSSQFSPEQLAAAFAQQQLIQQQQQESVEPFNFDPSPNFTPSPSTSIAPPPPPTHPVTRRTGTWPEENKENGTGPSTNGGADESVWVLRDSYLKKMQTENTASADEEMSWHEAATAAQEAAENGGNGGEEEQETDRLLNGSAPAASTSPKPGDRRSSIEKKKNSKETMVHEPAVLIEGVLFRARYLGSTQMLCESRGSKAARMAQAQEAVARVKAPDGDVQPSTEIDLFISTEKIMVLNTDLQRISDTDVRQDILMDHALRTISYIADIGDLVVLMARRMSTSHSDDSCGSDTTESGGVALGGVRKTPKVICHVFESDEASFIAQSIGQAFQVAYVEFLRANGIDDPSYLRQIDYQEVLNSQELLGDELEMFAKKETQKEVVVPKKSGEPLGIVVVESGWGSMLPTVVLAHMNPVGPAAHSNRLNIGDQIININGISLVGLQLSAAQTQIKNAKTATAVRMTVVSTPPVVEVRIRRPDTKYQLGFSVQNGVICSLLRGGIAERGGIRVGHRIIEINGTSVVAVAHDRIVNMLATAVGEIHMKTMPTSMFRLLTGQEQPQYI